MPPRTVSEWLRVAAQKLHRAGIETARLDTIVLLEDVLGINRAQLLAEPEREITPEHQRLLDALIQRRSTHEPLAYIRGKTEFYGRMFAVDQRVLEPRSESETMIDLLKSAPLAETPVIIDVGTGSGALAITAKLELPDARVFGIDIDDNCLAVANQNAISLGADCTFLKSNLLNAVPKDVVPDALLCNLPYVPDSFQINPAAMREPRLAIFGGQGGLDLYRTLFAQLQDRHLVNLLVLTESLPPQHGELVSIATAHGYVLEREEDFIQIFRTSSAPNLS